MSPRRGHRRADRLDFPLGAGYYFSVLLGLGGGKPPLSATGGLN